MIEIVLQFMMLTLNALSLFYKITSLEYFTMSVEDMPYIPLC